MIEIDNVGDVDPWFAAGSPTPASFLGIDLRSFTSRLIAAPLRDCAFLGCELEEQLSSAALKAGAFIVPERPGLPFRMFRPIYSVADIYSGFDPQVPGSWQTSFDHSAYSWFMDPATKAPRQIGLADRMAARTHDAAMERAIGRFLAAFPGRAVAFMGGHDRDRTDAGYRKVAALARELRRTGRMIITGGGPGFMEAANLGAFLAPYPDGELDSSLATLSAAPSYRQTHDWLRTACEVRTRLLGDWKAAERPESSNLGIPTWLYGHEPPNLFSSHIGKFFFNSLREDGLVTIADGGIVFAEGNAGTVQEIFQDVTQNYYRPAGLAPTPMVLFNSTPGFWNLPCDQVVDPARKKPVHQLLSQLAGERAASAFDSAVLLEEDPAKIVQFLTRTAPLRAGGEAEAGPTKGELWQAGFA
ncbi:MAG TPA: hypothetical protein VGB59_00840 [Allosphingosinicella sp.]|jgi:hypothetical protein